MKEAIKSTTDLYSERRKELSKKYNIDFDKLEKEQIKLSKELVIKDKIDIKLCDKFAGIDTIFIKNKILSCAVICNLNFEIIDKAYCSEKITFPYLAGFRSYREIPTMIKALMNLKEKPDLIFIQGQGISHPRLGIASHFSLAAGGIITIGVSNSSHENIVSGENILKENKIVGKVFQSKEKSNPLYISPGNNISIESALQITKKMIKPPHKNPEPLNLACKFSREIKKELELNTIVKNINN
jgi:deoxyribonuclease V